VGEPVQLENSRGIAQAAFQPTGEITQSRNKNGVISPDSGFERPKCPEVPVEPNPEKNAVPRADGDFHCLLRMSLTHTQAKIITITTAMKIQSAILKPNIFISPCPVPVREKY
jgi:hypothetical protein